MKDKKKKAGPPSDLTFKINSSLVFRYIYGFLGVNIIILLLGFFLIYWKADQGALMIRNQLELFLPPGGAYEVQIEGYRLAKTRQLEGFHLPKIKEQEAPAGVEKVERSIHQGRKRPKQSRWQALDRWDYQQGFHFQGQAYRISYSLGEDLRLFARLFGLLLLGQVLIIIDNSRKQAKKVQASLQPLADLAQTAKNFNQEGLKQGTGLEEKHLADLAQIIGKIDADKLDSKISIENAQNEVKDLASAINDLLQRVNQSYQAQIRFVSDASHELRTPIAVIQGYANLLDRWGKEDPATLEEGLAAIKAEAENMKELVEELLFLARGDNESLAMKKEVLDMNALIEEVVRGNQMITDQHDFHMDLSEAAWMLGDPQLIKQVLRILVDNSIKYSPEGGTILLKTLKKEGQIQVIIQDQGIGIAPEDLPHVFERFYRSDESRARQSGGTGLGLAIAKWIIDQHGGEVEILSRLNIGTRISLFFPAVEK